MISKFDVVVIGGGPGGYPAAIKAAQNGASVALIEANQMGGTCLNRGCIPTKTLIAGADVLEQVRLAEQFGISVGECHVDYAKMAARKDRVVSSIRKNLSGLLKANNITTFRGFATFTSPYELKVIGEDSLAIEAKAIIIATGSEPLEIPSFPFDYKRVHSSTSLLNLTELPKSLVIIGAGVIGCEFASMMQALGVEVTLVEALPRILATEADKVSTTLSDCFSKKGINIRTSVAVAAIDSRKEGVTVHLAGEESLDAEMALVAVGRKLNSDALGLEKAGVPRNDRGAIPVNSQMETEVSGIFAIGDVTGIWLLAHVATHQGLIAANNATGREAHIHYEAIPNVIYTTPEIATVGLTLKQAIAEGLPATIGAFPFQALGKAQASQHIQGFAQIVTNKKTGQILGAQVVGHEAGTLISEMTLAVQNELTIECLTETVHAHPTISEAWLEAAMVVQESPLHLPPRPKRQLKEEHFIA